MRLQQESCMGCRALRVLALGMVPLIFGAACSPASLVDVPPANGVVNPSAISNPASAAQFYNFATGHFASTFGGGQAYYKDYIISSGVFTDELMTATTPPFVWQYIGAYGMDMRSEVYSASLYTALHQSRTLQQQARQALSLYAPATSKALQGQLAAQEGYTVQWFAELFCSGVPLTSVPLVGSPVPTRGFSTDELLQRAVALFDSAIVLGADSASITALAKVGKGRALLQMGKFVEAANAVRDVPTNFVYSIGFSPQMPFANSEAPATGYISGNMLGGSPQIVQAVDHEGGVGPAWSADPRTGISTTPALSGMMRVVGKYSRTAGGTLDPSQSLATNPIRLADGIEARLIEAEADLAGSGTNWLAMLNDLRATCIGTAACAPVPGLTAAMLPALTDPGTPEARLDLLMDERAMWLYVTGHRQGDLRRLAHVYHRDLATVYPTGVYTNEGFPSTTDPGTTLVFPDPRTGRLYGTEVVFLVPESEKASNGLYSGCSHTQP